MAKSNAAGRGDRSNALWGSTRRDGDSSASASRRRNSGRRRTALLTGLVAVAIPLATLSGSAAVAAGTEAAPLVPDALLADARAHPDRTFRVIVQGSDGSVDAVADRVAKLAAGSEPGLAAEEARAAEAVKAAQADVRASTLARSSAATKKQQLARAAQDAATAWASAEQALAERADSIREQRITGRFPSIAAIAAGVTGRELTGLIDHGSGAFASITPDGPVAAASTEKWSSDQDWLHAVGADAAWGMQRGAATRGEMPAIAVVDTGIEDRADFDGRLVASVDLSSLPDNAPGDGRGHGTFVAGIAAGSQEGYTGIAPAANLVSLDVMDDSGMGLTSDVIRACEWILDNKDRYDIRVANFSLHSEFTAPFYLDPLDRAVEQLWFNGIVVVVAAGNYAADGAESGVLYSPANDPFVITVGAADLGAKQSWKDDTVAPWSAWGTTVDGFRKPELVAPGRSLVGPVPEGSTLVSEYPESVTAPGYIRLSGTSLAAPIVSGAAADVLARHPDFTPDQVKGSLMLSARPLDPSAGLAGGVGEVAVDAAMEQRDPPNPNAGLTAFVEPGTDGSGPVFDAASWNSAAQDDASWNAVSWNSASWDSASWNSASWSTVSWNSASWNSASWNSASWDSASWNSASWDSVSWNSVADGTRAHEDDRSGT